MNGGKIVEEGSHEALMNLKGVYSRLVEAQGLKKQIGGAPTPARAASPDPLSASQFEKKDHLADSGSEYQSHHLHLPQSIPKDDKHGKYSLPYLFMRMGSLVKDKWLKFALGLMSSIGMRS